jgi:hypothetical protein
MRYHILHAFFSFFSLFFLLQKGRLPTWDLFLIHSLLSWSRSGDCEGCRIRSRDCCVGSLDLLASAKSTVPPQPQDCATTTPRLCHHNPSTVPPQCMRCQWHRMHFKKLEFLREFEFIFEKALALYSGDKDGCFNKKNRGSKISWHYSFKKIIFTACFETSHRDWGGVQFNVGTFVRENIFLPMHYGAWLTFHEPRVGTKIWPPF